MLLIQKLLENSQSTIAAIISGDPEYLQLESTLNISKLSPFFPVDFWIMNLTGHTYLFNHKRYECIIWNLHAIMEFLSSQS